jgi:hypothetical protein
VWATISAVGNKIKAIYPKGRRKENGDIYTKPYLREVKNFGHNQTHPLLGAYSSGLDDGVQIRTR